MAPSVGDYTNFRTLGKAQAEAGTLTPYYRKKYGIRIDQVRYLIKMNDSYRRSFKDIAAWISKNL